MSDEQLTECKPTPHPDAIASGTCPAPSPEPTLTDAPTEPQPTTTTETPAPPPVEEPTLPITGSALAPLIITVISALAIAVILAWITRRRQNPKTW